MIVTEGGGGGCCQIMLVDWIGLKGLKTFKGHAVPLFQTFLGENQCPLHIDN